MEISKLDRNFLSSSNGEEKEGILWKNILEEPLSLEGLPFHLENKNPFYRLPERLDPILPSGIRELSHHTAGACVRFRSNSPFIRIQAELAFSCDMDHMPRIGSAGFDAYSRGPGEEEFTFKWPISVAPGKTLIDT